MNLKHFEPRLRLKQHELLSSLAGIENVIGEEHLSSAPGQGHALDEMLAEVQHALERLGDGTYGKCADCGNPIEPASLNATPWTLYCPEDQQKRDQKRSAAELSFSRSA